ncbi:MAG: helix-turn-helix domain-containing protein [Phycisphaerales bacterium]
MARHQGARGRPARTDHWVAQRLILLGWRQRDLAEITGLPHMRLGAMVNGEIDIPHDVAVLIARETGLDVPSIMENRPVAEIPHTH